MGAASALMLLLLPDRGPGTRSQAPSSPRSHDASRCQRRPDSDFLSHHLTAGRGSVLPRPDTSIRSGLGHGRDLTQEPVATARRDPTPQTLCIPDSFDEKIIMLHEASHRSPLSNAPAKRGRGMKLTRLTQDERLRTQLARVLDLSGAAGRAAPPVVDLLVRFALAKAFFGLGMCPGIGAADSPAAWPMIIVQVIGPVLMAIGLLVRPVALLILVLTLRAQFSGAAQEEHLFWATLFGWYVVCGPASLSLDRLLSKGMKHSPLPLATLAIGAGDWVNRAIGPLYVLAVRLWLAAALAVPALLPHIMLPAMRHCMLPAMQDGMLPSRLLIVAALLLAV